MSMDSFYRFRRRTYRLIFKWPRRPCKIWREHGALEYHECAGDDLTVKFGTPFPRLAKAKSEETVVFSWIVYKSRTHRDRVNAKVMKDPRMNGLCDEKSVPFDMNRMAWGGFKVVVEK
jgi:uncharacterized protein YbaA (DUF1428 family)